MANLVLKPAGPLREFVHKIVHVEFDSAKGTLMPLSPRPEPGIAICLPGGHRLGNVDGHGRMRSTPQAMVIGPQTRRNFHVVGAGRYVGLNILFQPTGFFRLFHQSLHDITDVWYDACDVLGGDFLALIDALQQQPSWSSMTLLVEQFLLSRVPGSRSASAVTQVSAAFASRPHGPDMGRLASSCGISGRQLERKFLEQVGMTPKRFERLIRFRSALQSKASSASTSWTRVTQDAGYYDQNHLIKDFRDLTGTTPSAYLRAISPSPATEMFDIR
jgi:AraC-like DNA-binding protein